MPVKTRKLVKGFTLLELMIVVAIVAILAALTYPSFMSNIQQTRRADATGALQLLRTRQEFFFSTDNNRTYTLNLADLRSGGQTPDGNYNLAIDAPCGDIARCYRITATAAPGSTQATDSNPGMDCTVLTIDSTNTKTPQACWKR